VADTCGYGEELSGSINAGNFLTSCKVYWLASQEGLCSMEKVSKYVETHFVLCLLLSNDKFYNHSRGSLEY
jgi:hypothetical protein